VISRIRDIDIMCMRTATGVKNSDRQWQGSYTIAPNSVRISPNSNPRKLLQ